MLSVIIPIAGKNRQEQAKVSMRFLRKQTLKDYETVLIEQVDAYLGDKELGGPFYADAPVDQYLAIKGPGRNHFNQPWMANVGARIAKGNKFLFLDIDIVFSKDYLEKVANYNKPYFFAHSRIHMLNEKESKRIRATHKINEDSYRHGETQESGTLKYAGFSVCVERNYFFNQLGGYNENYFGWGGNDNDIAWRSMQILKEEHMLDHEIFHLWHPKEYGKFRIWERKEVWLTTYRHPNTVTDRIKKANVGNPKKPSIIDLEDIREDPRKKNGR